MKDQVRLIELDSYEHGILINALNEFRNINLEQDKDTVVIEELLLKIIDAPIKKKFHKLLGER